MTYYTEYSSPAGKITLAGSDTHLVGLWFHGQKYFLGSLTETPVEKKDLAVFEKTGDWLNRYFAGLQPAPQELPLAPIGSEFRQTVWRHLLEIPYGEVTTYGAIAKKIATDSGQNRFSAQAVGNAVAHNPISIIIPCHRVVGSQGSLTGYAGGIEKKILLLTLEGVDTGKFFLPKST